MSSQDWLTSWHPIATSLDLPYRHTFQAKLLGRELAVWRADDDFVNVWENRCLHRGVRLSIGINDGRELRCQYHGWRYANRTAGCTYIPAHPADAPAQTICNRTFPGTERYGLIWSGEDPQGEIPSFGLVDGEAFALRSLPVNAPMELVLEHLADLDSAVFFVQPVDSNQSIIRPVLAQTPPESDRLTVLRDHNHELSRLRDTIEADAATKPAPEPMVATIEQVSLTQVDLPSSPAGRNAPLRVRVVRKWQAADGVAGFELESIGDRLPTQQPGAHIDVHLPNGLIRQYSLTNGPGEGTNYRIGVKLEPESRGGSSCLHETVREDDVLAISEPRNNFPLRRDSL
ncbi:MAG: Rieske 2Fe-2S domain-containing protein, partial [Acidimicrobiales bacterium]